MNLHTLSFIFGALLLLIGIIGGGFEIKELKLPRVGWPIRIISMIIGAFFIGMVFLKLPGKVDLSNKVDTPSKIDIQNKADISNERSKNQTDEIDFQIRKLEEKLDSLPQPPGPIHELEEIRGEHVRRFEEIEGLQEELRSEIRRLHSFEDRNPDARHRIRFLEGERLPDLEVEKRDIQHQLDRLQDEIHIAERREELKAEINELRKKRQALEKD